MGATNEIPMGHSVRATRTTYRGQSNPNQHGDRGKSKAIFISENLILFEKEDSLALIREYINAFARNYEDMQRLDPKVTVH